MSDETLRANMRQQMIAAGMPAEFAGIATDMAFHAADQAKDALMRVAFNHPDQRIGVSALGAAIGVMRMYLDVIQDAVTSTAKAHGATVTNAVVRG